MKTEKLVVKRVTPHIGGTARWYPLLLGKVSVSHSSVRLRLQSANRNTYKLF